MAAPRRSKFQIEDNRRDITRLYLRGKTQMEIAQQLGISRAMVAYDLAAIQERWRDDTALDLDAAKSRELAKIDELERTYWATWESSLEQKETTTTARTEAGDALRATAQMKKETRDGNPAFLEGVLKCIQRRGPGCWGWTHRRSRSTKAA